MSLSLTNPSLGLGLRNRILGALGLPGSSDFAMRDLWGNGEQGVWYEPYDPNALHQRRNLFTFTDQLNNVNWTKTGTTIGVDAYSDRWDKLIEDTSTGQHLAQSANLTASAGFTYTAQFKVKAAGRDKLRSNLSNGTVWGGGNPAVTIDLVAKTIVPTAGAFNQSLTSLGNDEWLVVYSATAVADGTSGIRLELLNAAGAVTYTGDGTSGAFFTDIQGERATSPTSYQRVTDWNTEYQAVADGLITMYQDAAGTTPVTAVEQPVGLVLDKRLGLVRGPELYTGQFTQAIDNSAGGAVYSFTESTRTMTISVAGSNTSYPRPRWELGMVAGRTYEVSGRIDGNRGMIGSIRLALSGSANNISYNNLTGEFAGKLPAAVSQIEILVNGTVAGTFNVALLSVREIPGNHATQTTAVARPVLSARKNLLTKTEQLTDAAWTKQDCTVVGDALIETVANAQHRILQTASASATVGGVFTHSAQFKQNVGTRNIGIRVGGVSGSAYIVFNPSTGAIVTSAVTGTNWTLASAPVAAVPQGDGWFSASISVLSNETGVMSVIAQLVDGTTILYTGDGNSSVRLKMEQLEFGNTATRYQRVNTSTDYDNYGFPHYLKFDGVDDFLVTGNIDFTVTDSVTIMAGITKTANAMGIVAELGTTGPVTTTGTFSLFANSAGNNFVYQQRGGGTNAQASSAAESQVSNVPYVITGRGDVSLDQSILRSNAVQQASSAADQGAGNFINAAIFIGRRAGTSIPLNGQLNSLAVRGAASTDNQIKEAERAIASKTGVTLP